MTSIIKSNNYNKKTFVKKRAILIYKNVTFS